MSGDDFPDYRCYMRQCFIVEHFQIIDQAIEFFRAFVALVKKVLLRYAQVFADTEKYCYGRERFFVLDLVM